VRGRVYLRDSVIEYDLAQGWRMIEGEIRTSLLFADMLRITTDENENFDIPVYNIAAIQFLEEPLRTGER